MSVRVQERGWWASSGQPRRAVDPVAETAPCLVQSGLTTAARVAEAQVAAQLVGVGLQLLTGRADETVGVLVRDALGCSDLGP